ncbi:hypothetical protein KY285_000788 [Solanum tuberosum]|nr:hypothetical protein KY285_000788 [Solanum tuberosum]
MSSILYQPKVFGMHLSSLQHLYVSSCNQLQSLAESALPCSLSEMTIQYCCNLQSLPVKVIQIVISLSELIAFLCHLSSVFFMRENFLSRLLMKNFKSIGKGCGGNPATLSRTGCPTVSSPATTGPPTLANKHLPPASIFPCARQPDF